MYTIAYRIHRDNLGQNHPSLVVLLNMLASIQIKRGKIKEAMQIEHGSSKLLCAYVVALRGMKYALGRNHPNVAAVLGNIGTLQKEMGDMDSAYHTYQEVLGIESYRLGLSHPDVAITLHNIATIDAARENYDEALKLYRKIIMLQKKLFVTGPSFGFRHCGMHELDDLKQISNIWTDVKSIFERNKNDPYMQIY